MNVAMKAPPGMTGHFYCCGPGESGRVYMLPEPGGTIEVSVSDQRGLRRIGFVAADEKEPDHWDWWRRYQKQRAAESDFVPKFIGCVWTCPRLPGRQFDTKD